MFGYQYFIIVVSFILYMGEVDTQLYLCHTEYLTGKTQTGFDYYYCLTQVTLPIIVCQLSAGDGSYSFHQEQQQHEQPYEEQGGAGRSEELPVSCRIKFNQLFCTEPGSGYPSAGINKYLDDNKALLRRMFGELQERRTVTQTSVTIVTSFAQTR